MAKIYYESDASLDPLKGKTVAVIGYGSQGRAQALNMKDSGVKVIVGLRPGGKSWELCKKDGLEPYAVDEASERADLIQMLIPDMAQPGVYKTQVAPHLREGKALGFSHGYNIHFKLIEPPKFVDVIMIAPKAPGPRMREVYVEGKGVPALLAIHQDATGKAKQTALAWAKAIGATKAGVFETSFKEETESDLFGEQTVLVGGVMELIKKGYEVLVESGYQPELAYFEACNELKLITDLIYTGGLEGMLRAVSDTAKYGGLNYGPKVIDDRVKENMRKILQNVRSGNFSKEWTGNPEQSMMRLNRQMDEMRAHQIEKVGKEIRRMAGQEQPSGSVY